MHVSCSSSWTLLYDRKKWSHHRPILLFKLTNISDKKFCALLLSLSADKLKIQILTTNGVNHIFFKKYETLDLQDFGEGKMPTSFCVQVVNRQFEVTPPRRNETKWDIVYNLFSSISFNHLKSPIFNLFNFNFFFSRSLQTTIQNTF